MHVKTKSQGTEIPGKAIPVTQQRLLSATVARRPLLNSVAPKIPQSPLINPVVSFHVNTILPKKSPKLRYFPSTDEVIHTQNSQLFSSFEKYGMYYSFENPSISHTITSVRQGNCNFVYKGKARVVVDISKLDKYCINPKPSTSHRKKMIEKCPKLRLLYQLKRDVNPQTHAIVEHRQASRIALRKSL